MHRVEFDRIADCCCRLEADIPGCCADVAAEPRAHAPARGASRHLKRRSISDLRRFARASSSNSSVFTISPLTAIMSATVRKQCLAQGRGPAFRQAQASRGGLGRFAIDVEKELL
jgi:hypothetical protein